MKRSAMLGELMPLIQDFQKGYITASELADLVLGCVEQQGMSPPHVKVLNCNCYDHNWEPEDKKQDGRIHEELIQS